MKYLNAVLTVIAVCLVLITFAVTGLIPSAQAKDAGQRFVSVPVNADGSIDVNIESINGSGISGREIPISTNSTIDVNLKQMNGSYFNLPLRVKNE